MPHKLLPSCTRSIGSYTADNFNICYISQFMQISMRIISSIFTSCCTMVQVYYSSLLLLFVSLLSLLCKVWILWQVLGILHIIGAWTVLKRCFFLMSNFLYDAPHFGQNFLCTRMHVQFLSICQIVINHTFTEMCETNLFRGGIAKRAYTSSVIKTQIAYCAQRSTQIKTASTSTMTSDPCDRTGHHSRL